LWDGSINVDIGIQTNTLNANTAYIDNIAVYGGDYVNFLSPIDIGGNEIQNIGQTTNTNSATTNLCLPTYTFITGANTGTYNNTGFAQILADQAYFFHSIPFYKYRIQFSFSGIANTCNITSYFYCVLSNADTEATYNGLTYNSTNPYTCIQGFNYNNTTSFEFIDLFDTSLISPLYIGHRLYILLYALNYDSYDIGYSNVNCFVVTEPFV
jgi:hypothetical protein